MKKLKKSNFLEGAFIATLCIIITKILGVVYVIPFYIMLLPSAADGIEVTNEFLKERALKIINKLKSIRKNKVK